jgi:hypothetical protein
VNVSRVLAGLVGAVLGLLPVAPPDHVHAAQEEGHVHIVIHRHLEPHGLLHHRDASNLAFDDNDDYPIVTLTLVYTVPVAPSVAPLVRYSLGALIGPPPPLRSERAIVDVESLIHGPPRAPTSLRGPPSSTLL